MTGSSSKFLFRALAVVFLIIAALLFYTQRDQKAAEYNTCRAVKQNPEAAIPACSELLSTSDLSDTNRAKLHEFRGLASVSLEDWPNAAKDFERSTELVPDDDLYWQWLSDALGEMDEYQAALDAIEIAISLNPSSRFNHQHHLQMLWRLGRIAEMEARAKESMADFPEAACFPEFLGYVLHREKRHQEASRHLKTGLALDPASSYGRKKFFEVCRSANDACPPLFPETRHMRPTLGCDEAWQAAADLLPASRNDGAARTIPDLVPDPVGNRSLQDLVADSEDGWALAYSGFLGAAISFEQNGDTKSAEHLIIFDRLLECTQQSYFDHPLFDQQMYLQFQVLYSKEIRENLLDLAHMSDGQQ